MLHRIWLLEEHRFNVRDNVEWEAPSQAPQVLVNLLVDQVTNAEFSDAFEVLVESKMIEANKKVVVPMNPMWVQQNLEWEFH